MVHGMAMADDRLWLVLAALPAILSIGGGSHTVTMAQQTSSGPEFADITQFFDGIKDDRTNVSWAHAVNNRSALQKALGDDTMMLEADVSLGTVNKSTVIEPIMAHPPANTSDLSLKDFLTEVDNVVVKGKKKGVKLDFKSTEVFNKSVPILRDQKFQMSFPMWLNADIVSGPTGAEPAPVSPEVFLNVSKSTFPTAGLSVGWTTTKPTLQQNTSCYTASQLNDMVDALRKAELQSADNVTLAVRAVYAGRCVEQLNKLLTDQLPKATLTVWNSNGDEELVSIKQLQELIDKVKKNRIYLDLPEKMLADVMNKTPKSSSSRVGSIAALVVLSLTLALSRFQ